ncbi:MAG: transcription antitermination factor NusB [Candidatus Tectomicrobia bacterium]|uniref:Transcription antitermination protein NusB n=1 Tax=Tectimicrobiota bacterium TaxID=2528274 RepID=A0A933GN49_UNCTE|nr:transcription antitermination factor NusB [Candidatus Tectomicrobia bacterium]
MSRRKGRELALQMLYQMDITRGEALKSDSFPEIAIELSEEAKKFTQDLIQGITEKQGVLDEIIRKYSLHWSLERMFIIDRNILRMAIFELKYMEDIPPKVTINEAIEIAKRYGTKDSSGFINGILDQVMNDLKNQQQVQT